MDAAQSALQTAREQIGSCAKLSQAGRRDEGLAALDSAEQTLQGLIKDLGRSTGQQKDQGFRQEVRSLQVAALLAKAIDAEQFMPPMGSEEAAEQERQAFALYAEAKKLAESSLPASHSMVSLTRHLFGERAVCTPVPGAASSSSSRRSTNGQLQSSKRVTVPPPTIDSSITLKSLSQSAPILQFESASPLSGRSAADQPRTASSSKQRVSPEEVPKKAASSSMFVPKPGDNKDRLDIFAEFIKEDQLATMMRKGFFNSRQEDLRKHVHETARYTRLQNVGKSMAELTDKKFGHAGHKIQMAALLKENRTRNNQALLRESKTSGGNPAYAPEVILARQLRMQLQPKEPPKPEVKKPTKQEVFAQSALAAGFGDMFKVVHNVDKSVPLPPSPEGVPGESL